MARVTVRTDVDVALDDPVLVEGLPGIGLVGKIAADHIAAQLDMTYYAGIDCEGIPEVAVYEEGDRTVRPPVRIYADEESDLLVLRSDVPISRTAEGFADCITGWIREVDALPVYLSGFPADEPADVPALYGVATGAAAAMLDEHGIDSPPESGVVGGPTGALLHRAAATDLDAVGLVVETDPRFPDPAAARQLILDGINPIAGIEADTDELVERAEEIREHREQFAQRMQQLDEDASSQAQPLRMYQ